MVELKPGGSVAVKKKQRAELSSLQSSLNSTNRICYRCNGRNEERGAEMRCGFLEVVGCDVGMYVFSHDRKFHGWLAISAYFSLQRRTPPPLCLSPVSAEPYVTEALIFSLP